MLSKKYFTIVGNLRLLAEQISWSAELRAKIKKNKNKKKKTKKKKNKFITTGPGL